MNHESFWKDKCVLITGASSGLGWALAEHLSGCGARVGLTARREEKLRALAEKIRAGGGRAEFAAADVADAPALEAALRSLTDALGPCDVLIANAGMHRYTRGDVFSGACARDVFAVNVNGVITAIDTVLPAMIEHRAGHIATVASIAAMVGLPEVGAYSASKAALVTLMESLRVDLHRFGVRVTTICPGFIETPMIASHPRKVLKFLLSAEAAAGKIERAIRRGKAEYWFPWQMWLAARLVRALPFGVYRWICNFIPERSR